MVVRPEPGRIKSDTKLGFAIECTYVSSVFFYAMYGRTWVYLEFSWTFKKENKSQIIQYPALLCCKMSFNVEMISSILGSQARYCHPFS